MSEPSANLIVIYTERLSECHAFYTDLGLEFLQEQHGAGPVHVAARLAGDTVLELHPGSGDATTGRLRLGVEVAAGPGREPGRTRVVDPDGRVVELHVVARAPGDADGAEHVAETEPLTVLDVVVGFRGPFWPLSNFFPHDIVIDGSTYPTVEHWFQAEKALHAADRDRIRAAATPAEAKRLGRSVAMVDDWPTRRVEVMRRGLAAKFALESEPGRLLLATGHATLVEGNDWGDQLWGVSGGRGRNLLGTLLTERRGVLRQWSGTAD
jgi:N-glycosidase YbiA